MYGKTYPEMFTGSLVGTGPLSFALMTYVVTHARIEDSTVDLNPLILGTIFGIPEKEVASKIAEFCEPDPKSRSKDEKGRRLVKVGEFTYKVVNLRKYRFNEGDEKRRKYWREYKASKRKSTQNVHMSNMDICGPLGNVHHTDTDTDAGTDTETTSSTQKLTLPEVIAIGQSIGCPEDVVEQLYRKKNGNVSNWGSYLATVVANQRQDGALRVRVTRRGPNI